MRLRQAVSSFRVISCLIPVKGEIPKISSCVARQERRAAPRERHAAERTQINGLKFQNRGKGPLKVVFH